MNPDNDNPRPAAAPGKASHVQNEPGDESIREGNACNQGRAENVLAMAPADTGALLFAQQSKPVGRRRTFPLRLHTLLSDVEVRGQTDIVSWQPHGRSFAVHKTDEFVRKLLPSYFQQTKWSSFQRQLNLYSFERISQGADRGSYYHSNFLRGQPNLCLSIARTKVKGTKVRVPSDAKTEPDFYKEPALEQTHYAGYTSHHGLAGHDRLIYPTLPMYMPLMANNTMQLFGNANNAVLLQSFTAADPQALYTVHPSIAQAFLSNAFALHSGQAASMPAPAQTTVDQSHLIGGLFANPIPTATPTLPVGAQSQSIASNIDMSAIPMESHETTQSVTAGGAAFSSLPVGVQDGDNQTNSTSTFGHSSIQAASIPASSQAVYQHPMLSGASVAHASADIQNASTSGFYQGEGLVEQLSIAARPLTLPLQRANLYGPSYTMASVITASETDTARDTTESSEAKDDTDSQPSEENGYYKLRSDKAGTSAGGMSADETSNVDTSGARIPGDDVNNMHNMYETMGEAVSEGEQEWGKFLQRYFD